MAFAYLTFLLLSIVCMVLCDWRFTLAFFADARRAALLSAAVVALFLLWDALGIATGTFFRGDSPFMIGVELAPEVPLEEPIFLFFLTYLTLNVTSGARKVVGP
ncbi:lycopene cyclase domain-containing protein [uncultured Corynebacterium sp.]|uniref:lycopene cyclase domain-containing protein n=1 Tax=uncultured Corynebacterium sp. TaxID=159447 RepID=UPI002597982A|nr:lycopene cyclase domain-containing protein [uncultured Corynebacterium sp.]